MILDIVFLIGGFVLLIKGADYLVDGASDVAKRFGVSSLVIGLTVVAFGTSAPELAVNILSAVSGNTEIALGNINGSNIANILLVLGVTALFVTIPVQSRTVIKEIPFMLLSGVVLLMVMLDTVIEGTPVDMISRIDGLMLLAFFAIFIYYLFLSAKDVTTGKTERAKRSFFIAGLLAVGGLAMLFVGGQITVNGAVGIAEGLGVSESLIALTIVALGTSLPELVTAVVAARKGQTDMAIGNVVGSSVFNILLVLGATSVIAPISVSTGNIWDATVALGAMIVLMIAVQMGEGKVEKTNKDVSKREGLLMLTLYFAYIFYIIIRG